MVVDVLRSGDRVRVANDFLRVNSDLTSFDHAWIAWQEEKSEQKVLSIASLASPLRFGCRSNQGSMKSGVETHGQAWARPRNASRFRRLQNLQRVRVSTKTRAFEDQNAQRSWVRLWSAKGTS